ncbi:hypothetical protein [Novosphingobium sp. B1]|uniref:hypothetical protein n=1 Tax=Novosphingobium sp. B1 TaxID=1938756 RepID=UPI00111BE387|nr:hypothetical protein [Novosphingobium sp. B1]
MAHNFGHKESKPDQKMGRKLMCLDGPRAAIRDWAENLASKGLGVPESTGKRGAPNWKQIEQDLGFRSGLFAFKVELKQRMYKVAEELGLMKTSEYCEAMGLPMKSPHRNKGRELLCLDDHITAITAWGTKLASLGLGVPESERKAGEPNKSLIEQELGFREKILKYKPELLAQIGKLAEELGFVKTVDYCAKMGLPARRGAFADRAEAKSQKLDALLNEKYISQSAPLPEAMRALGKPAYREILREAGINFYGYKRDLQFLRQIDEAAYLVGIGKDAFRPARVAEPTFGDLLRLGQVRYQHDLGAKAAISWKRFESALRRFMKLRDLTELDLCSDVMVRLPQFVETMGKAHFQNSETRRRWLANMAIWQKYARMLMVPVGDAAIPSGFNAALTYLLRVRKFENVYDALKEGGLDYVARRLPVWLKLDQEPIKEDVSVVHDLERFLEVPVGTLVSRMRTSVHRTRQAFPERIWPPSLDTAKLRALAAPLLPADFASLSEDEREKLGLSIREEATNTTEYRIAHRARKRWRIKPTLVLQNEFDALHEYKTSKFPAHPREKRWREPSFQMYTNWILEFMSFLALSPDEGGCGVEEASLTVALLACLPIVRRFLQWKFDQTADEPHTGVSSFIGVVAHLTNPLVPQDRRTQARRPEVVKGWLHYRPDLAAHLVSIPALLCAEEIEVLNSPEGWSKNLCEVNEFLWKTFYENTFVNSRNPFEAIEPILDMDRPRDVLIDLLDELRLEMGHHSPYRRAIAMRRYVAIMITIHTALRVRNVAELTINCKKAKFYKRGNQWIIRIPAREFKNEDGSFFKNGGNASAGENDFICALPLEETAYIDDYVSVARPLLMTGVKEHDRLLVTRSGLPIDGERISRDMDFATWKHVVHHEVTGSGIVGVCSFRTHAVRDITATHILKQTHNIDMAADALQDNPMTVKKHYASFFTEDKTKSVMSFLQSDMHKRPSDPQIEL